MVSFSVCTTLLMECLRVTENMLFYHGYDWYVESKYLKSALLTTIEQALGGKKVVWS